MKKIWLGLLIGLAGVGIYYLISLTIGVTQPIETPPDWAEKTVSPTLRQADSSAPSGVACPADARLCPDGSSVGRIAPDCEFAPCPVLSPTSGVKLTNVIDRELFSLSYPADYEMRNEGEMVILMKWGPTQEADTELFDGISLVLEEVNFAGRSLAETTQQMIADLEELGTAEIVSAAQPTRINNYQAWTYSASGLGVFKNYVLQKNHQSSIGLVIRLSVDDPGNLGFQAEVDQILQSLVLKK